MLVVHCVLRQQQVPADLEGGLGWSHPSVRKSSTGMPKSILWQLGELLDKTADVVPEHHLIAILETKYSIMGFWNFVLVFTPSLIFILAFILCSKTLCTAQQILIDFSLNWAILGK